MLAGRLGRRDKLEGTILRDGLRQITHKVENAAGGSLVLPEGLVIHEEVDDFPFGLFQPGKVFLGRQGPVFPTLVRETESNVVAERVVPQQQFQFGLLGAGIYIVRALPTHDVAGALGKHRLEAQLIDLPADAVGIDELGVPERFRRLAEELLHQGLVFEHLVAEFGLRSQRGQGVVIGLGQEFHAAGIGQGAERINHFGGIALKLLQHAAGERKSHLECPFLLLDDIQQQLVHRQIALLCHPLEDGPVGKIVIVVGILADIEKPVQAQPRGLVDLEI